MLSLAYRRYIIFKKFCTDIEHPPPLIFNTLRLTFTFYHYLHFKSAIYDCTS